jgi:hypothetical protein
MYVELHDQTNLSSKLLHFCPMLKAPYSLLATMMVGGGEDIRSMLSVVVKFRKLEFDKLIAKLW